MNEVLLCLFWFFVGLVFGASRERVLTEKHNMKKQKIIKVDNDTKWECVKCGWQGKLTDSADKTPVVKSLYLLVCPICSNKKDFFIVQPKKE